MISIRDYIDKRGTVDGKRLLDDFSSDPFGWSSDTTRYIVAAMLMAGLDGIQNKIEPPEALNVDIYELSAEEKSHIKSTPGSLGEALTALEEDHEFLLKGGVFTKDLLESFIDIKRTKDIVNIALRPHPYEFFMYYDA